MLLVILAWYKGASRTGDGVTKQGWKVQRCDGWKPKRSSKTGEQNLTYVLLMPHSASGGFLQVEGHCTVREHSPSMYSFFFHSPSLPWPLWRLAHSEGETFFLAEAGILFVHWKQHCPWKAARRTLQHSPLCLPLSLLLSLHASFSSSIHSSSSSLSAFSVVEHIAQHGTNKSSATARVACKTTSSCSTQQGWGLRFIVSLLRNVAKNYNSCHISFPKALRDGEEERWN